jgi:hypothetical protein
VKAVSESQSKAVSTMILPSAFAGTVAFSCVALMNSTTAFAVPNLTVDEALKFVPVIVQQY